MDYALSERVLKAGIKAKIEDRLYSKWLVEQPGEDFESYKKGSVKSNNKIESFEDIEARAKKIEVNYKAGKMECYRESLR